MKISSLTEYTLADNDPANATSPAPQFGRSDKFLEDEQIEESGVGTTTAGAVVTGGGAGSIFSGIKTSKRFPNSAAVKEDEEPEGSTVKNSLHTIIRVATHLDKQMSTGEDFPEWVSEKIGAVKEQMVSVMDYEISDKEMQHDPDAEIEEARVGNRMSDIKIGSPKIVNYKGKAVGEVGLDHEASPGNGPYYFHHYLTGKSYSGYDTKKEALADLKHIVQQMDEGAKVDRMQGHIEKSERKLGHSKDEAENIAWATLNKRGYLNNKNKKEGIEEAGDWTKLPNGNWRNMHTGVQQSTPPKQKKVRKPVQHDNRTQQFRGTGGLPRTDDNGNPIEENWKDTATLLGAPVVAGALAVGAQHYDDQQPHVEVGGQNAKIVSYGSSQIPDYAMTLKGADGKMYRVWTTRGAGGGHALLAAPEEKVKEDLSRRGFLKGAGAAAAGLAGGAFAKGGGGGGGHASAGGHASSGGHASGGHGEGGHGEVSGGHGFSDAPEHSFRAGTPFVPVTGHDGYGNDADRQEYIKFLTSYANAIRAGKMTPEMRKWLNANPDVIDDLKRGPGGLTMGQLNADLVDIEARKNYHSIPKNEGVAEGLGAYDDDKGIKHTRGSLVTKLESLPKGSDEFEWNRQRAIQYLKQGNSIAARFYMAKMKRNEGITEAELTEEDMLVKDLYRQLDLFKKGENKEITNKPLNKDISKKPTDKEVQKKK